jgi:hypothetical protein
MGGFGIPLPEWLGKMTCGDCGSPLHISRGLRYVFHHPRYKGRPLDPYLEVEGILWKRFYVGISCSAGFSKSRMCFFKHHRLEVTKEDFIKTLDYVNSFGESDRNLKISTGKKDRFIRRD